MTISTYDTLCRAPDLAGRLFEERMLVITAADSMLHSFNEAGTFIWQILEKPKRTQDIVAALADHFQGFDTKKNNREVIAFLEDLEKKGK